MVKMSEIKVREVECLCDQLSDDSNDEISFKLKTKGVKRRKEVIDEDLYVQQIDKIIERDFFPDLQKVRPKSEPENNESVQKLCPQREESPSTFETPLRSEEIPNESEGNIFDDKSQKIPLSLDQFLNKYTSEDNASFERIQEREERKHRIKYKWLYKDLNQYNNSVENLLKLPSIEKQSICESETKQSDEQSGQQSGCPVTWRYKHRNALMFNPSGVSLTGQYRLDNTKRQEVVHSNTRFERKPFNQKVNQMAICLAAQLNQRQKEGKIGIDGKELVTKETPQINGFKFVASTPTPAPELYCESPLMTWGEIEATPMSLSGSDTPSHPGLTTGSHFKIPEVPEREKIGLSLAIRNAKQNRDKKKQAFHSIKSSLLTPDRRNSLKTSLERLNSMSPAAQRLATLKLGMHHNLDRALMASYSPARTATTPSTPKLLSPLTHN